MKSTFCTLFHQFSNHLADTLHNALSRDSYQIDFPVQSLSSFCEVGSEFQTLEPLKKSGEIGQNRELIRGGYFGHLKWESSDARLSFI
jgi:hypothetical protein